MNRITNKINKIVLIIFITLMGMITTVNASLTNPENDKELAAAAEKATKGTDDAYFTFDATKLIGKTIDASDAHDNDKLAPYQHVGEYCIDSRASANGSNRFTIMNIIDITPDGRVISYKNTGNNIEVTDTTTVNYLKTMAYCSIKSINANEQAISSGDAWKVALQGTLVEAKAILINKLGLNSCFKNGLFGLGANEKRTEAKNNSKMKAYTGRFIFLYGNGKQNQIIFGAKEGEGIGDLTIKKTGAGNKALDNVGFILKNKDTGEYVSKESTTEKVVYTKSKSQAKEYYTNSKGEITIEGLKIGNYELYETKNPHYGYVVDTSKAIPVTIKAGNNTKSVSNKQVYVKLSGYVWIDKAGEKSSKWNDLYKAITDDDGDTLFNGITVRLKDRTTGDTIQETTTAKLDRYIGSGNDGNGEYLFTDVLITKLQDYYVEFEYDGLTYTNVTPYITQDKGSKAAESIETRDNFNKDFSVVEGNTSNTGFTRNANGEIKHTLSYNIDEANHVATLINNGQYKITSNTDVPDYSIKNNFTVGQEEIRYINLGLKEREQPNLAIIKDMQNVKVTINGYGYTYFYSQRYSNKEYGDGFNVGVKFEEKYQNMTYTRAIYQSDADFASEDKSKELKVYVTYELRVNNTSSLTTQVNSIAEYFDSRYTIEKVGTGINSENGEIEGIIPNPQVESYNSEYNKAIINTNTKLEAGKNDSIYIQFALDRQAVLDILNNKENLDNVVEINSYSTYDNNGKIYAGIDSDSNPGNCEPGESRTYQDDTDASPALKLEVADARELSGKVFEDDVIPEKGQDATQVMTGKIRQGSGAYEEGEKGIEGVEVTFTENTGSGQVYTTKTNANGDFFLSNYIPGEYTLTYTWGDQTYTVQNYKGTIYDSTRDQNNKSWYKENVETRLSDAIDNYETRKAIDEEMAIVNNNTVGNLTIHKMDSSTPTMEIGVEYETTYTASMGDRYTYHIKNLDFGIIERAKQDVTLRKRIKSFKVTLANGIPVVDLEIDENGNITGQKDNITYEGPNLNVSPSNGFIRLEIDNEMMQGSTLEIEYEFIVTNQSELDYLSENYYKYGLVEGDTITIQPTGIIDYLDEEWAFDDTKNLQWQVKTLDEIKDLRLVSQEVYQNPESTIANKTILYTEALKEEKIKPEETATTTLNVSKMITTRGENSFDNEAEIVGLSKSGGSMLEFIPGNYIPGVENAETDGSKAETAIITPPNGEDRNFIMPIALGITALITLGAGVIFIKKKVM